MDTDQGAAGSQYAGLEVRNTSNAPCELNGYFGVQIVDSGGNNLQLTYTPTSGNGVTPSTVTLPPNTAPLNSGNDQGHAIFYMRWNDTCNNPENVANFLFTPPHLSGTFSVAAQVANGPGGSTASICAHIDIGPISPRGTQQPF